MTGRTAGKAILARLRREVRAHPDDPDVLYRLAVMLVSPAELRRPDRRRRLRACELLERATRLRRDFAAAHALLAYVRLELDDPKAAVSSLRRAVELAPEDDTFRDFFLQALDEAGRHRTLKREIEEAARRRRVDLSALRAEIRAVGFPSDPSTLRANAFPAGERHFLSGLSDEVEAIEREYGTPVPSDLELAEAARRAVRIDARRVPADLRGVVALARKWGVSDDAHRGLLVERASPAERAELRRALPRETRRRISAWLDGFGGAAEMSPEAGHFMYLLEAFDEM